MHGDRTALLLINVGTPDSPAVADVRRYLREFLSDSHVIDIAGPLRWLLLNLIILPRRPRHSAEAYAQIWTEQGSPLLVHSRTLVQKVQSRLADRNITVELAMRYGNPSIGAAFDRLRSRGVDRIVALPLYPQNADATTGSTVAALRRAASTRQPSPALQIVPPFFDHPAFIEAAAQVAGPVLQQANAQRVLFSYHGLPERHLRKADPTGQHCLTTPHCCDTLVAANGACYRAQCVATTAALGDALDIPAAERVLCFQSRLGRDPWIGPHTDHVLAELAAEGIKRIAVVTPSFVTDCLETLEEIGIRARQTWLSLGGSALHLAPCLNASDIWADAITHIAAAIASRKQDC